MHRIGSTALVFAWVTLLGLAPPPSVAACAGCDTSFREFIDNSYSIVLASYRGRSGSRVVFDVIDVLKGPAARVVLLEPTAVSPGPRPWGRWLLAPDGDAPVAGVMDGGPMVEGFRVSSTGAVTNTLPGSGAVNVYPRTLAGWYRALRLAMPDTSSADAAPPAEAPTRMGAQILMVSAGIGAAAALLRRRRPKPARSAVA